MKQGACWQPRSPDWLLARTLMTVRGQGGAAGTPTNDALKSALWMGRLGHSCQRRETAEKANTRSEGHCLYKRAGWKPKAKGSRECGKVG